MASGNEIRSTFIEFFRKNGHEVVASSPLVPRNDPSLLFTNSGMVQFKNVFTGTEQRPYQRATTAQKCVRAGGKHNDLENVGYTARHHTFFEMLGNFSFGDYFKSDAIDFAWNLVTKEYGLAKSKLLVTVYGEDEEAADLWKKVAGLSDDRIIRISTSDNFWQMGDTGPCGPCSEIFFDHGDKIPGGPPGSADGDGDRFIEIWNLVFMQYEQQPGGKRIALPRPSIDTGMGLERIAAILQGKHDNYDTDLLRSLIESSAELTRQHADGPHAVSHRVIADHLRSSAFLIADGVLPSNEGRGYVLRRIMRRGMRHAHKLGSAEPLMFRLVPSLVRMMGAAYPELNRAEALITETLKLEETRFRHTLERGLKLLDEELTRLPQGTNLAGDVAFRLYDTFGFPLDLTQDILRGQNRAVDVAGFDTAMAKQRTDARKAWAGSGEAATETLWFGLREKHSATEFLGYMETAAEGNVLAIIKDGKEVSTATAGDQVAIMVNQTPFYGESGGQQGDQGSFFAPGGLEVAIEDTQKKLGDLFVHMGKVVHGTLKVGMAVNMRIDAERRAGLRAHHSVTHLLHEALRRRLGDHVTQKGSLVAADRLRFDFSQPRPLTSEDIAAVEADVNARILVNADVTTRLMTPDAAVAAGALALFGEKYGDEVRVVSMGGAHEKKSGAFYSTELCGGTHVTRTGDIGLFRIISEEGLAAGVRRIEAVAGKAAIEWTKGQSVLLAEIAGIIKSSPQDLPGRLTALLDERKKLERDLADLRRKLATGGGDSGAAPEIRTIGKIKYIGRALSEIPPRELKAMADDLKRKLGSAGVVALATTTEGKASLVVGVTDDLTPGISAVELVRVGAETLGGKGGGGRPDMAQAGGPDVGKIDAAIEAIAGALG